MSNDLVRKCVGIRQSIMEMIASAGSGHAGASLSMIELLAVLYDTGWLQEEPRDRFVLSKGHGGIGFYAVLAAYGILPSEWLCGFGTQGPLMNHPDAHRTPGVEVSTGSLGHGLSIAVGMRMALAFQNSPSQVFCLMGDSEIHEGSVWEAAMLAGSRGLKGLTAIVDLNGMGNDGKIQVNLQPLAQKWQSFGWHPLEIDGHDILAIREAYQTAKAWQEGPCVVLAHTQKGRGLIPSLAGSSGCHYLKGSPDQIRAMFQPEIRGCK